MYAVTSIWLLRRTRATLRSAEFGFFGVMVFTTVQTPRFWGHPCMAGCFGFERCTWRGFFTSWLIVGIPNLGSLTDSVYSEQSFNGNRCPVASPDGKNPSDSGKIRQNH